MKIALDFDKTYSADAGLWREFIASARRRGHEVRIVTARSGTIDRTPALVEAEKDCPVIYTNGVAKGWYCQHFTEGWVPDIVVDDKPESWLENSRTSPVDLAEWRRTRQY